MSEAPCELLPWDSEHFGVPIARVRGQRLDDELAHAVAAWCAESGVRCVYLLARAEDPATARAAERAGYRLVDLRVTYDRSPVDHPSPDDARVRPARESDLAALRDIARSAHRDARFHFDTAFARERCDELYAAWIENSYRGFADAVLVADVDGPAGYITLHAEDGAGRIGLVAVAERARRMGLGRALVDAALAWSSRRGHARITVVTQARNVASQRLYQDRGFRTRDVAVWYHGWPAKVPTEIS